MDEATNGSTTLALFKQVAPREYDETQIIPHNILGELNGALEAALVAYVDRVRSADQAFKYRDRYTDMEIVSEHHCKYPVFRARVPSEGDVLVAVKVKRPGMDRGLHMEMREVMYLSELSSGGHPNIVRMRRAFVSPRDEIYIEMDYHPQTVYDVLVQRRRPMDLEQVRVVMAQLLLALWYCHSFGILHCDVKLPNLLLSKDSVLKLADFDASVGLGIPARPLQNVKVNADGYRPIEVLTVQPFTFSPDIWAAGCCLVDMFCPSPPIFKSGSQAQIEAIHAFAGPIPPGYFIGANAPGIVPPSGPVRGFDSVFACVPAIARPFLKRLLTLNPAERPSSCAIRHDPFLFMNFD